MACWYEKLLNEEINKPSDCLPLQRTEFSGRMMNNQIHKLGAACYKNEVFFPKYSAEPISEERCNHNGKYGFISRQLDNV